MKKSDVKIGNHYKAKVTDKVVTIEILAENPHGGWDAKNLSTGKTVRIKSPQRLRGAVAKTNTSAPGGKPKQQPSKDTPKAKSPTTAKPVQNTLRTNKMSILDAAAQVLSEAKEPLNCKLMVKAMTDKAYWQPSQSGKTPANTLHAAISKEIKTKAADSRFEKVGRGQFALSATK